MPGERRPGMDHALYDYSALPNRPHLQWPQGRVALWVILYLEHWELDPPADSHRPPGIQGVRESIFPDYRTFSHREYGNRVGAFRLLDLLDTLRVRPTVALNAALCRKAPRLVKACVERGWEVAVHGTHATRMITSRMTEAQEREHIAMAIDEVRGMTGQYPAGWIGQEYGESTRTPFLVAEQGMRYIADWPNDEQPYTMLTTPGLVSLPQQPNWDDVQLLWLRQIATPRYAQIVRDACDTLLDDANADGQGRMLCLGLHPWLSGQSHRIRHVREALSDVATREGVWNADGATLASHYTTCLAKTNADGEAR
ncbi:MAG: polysaccharide deacetylase family protein [Rubrivivax sp.]|nr:polysaccharide deacetylase family protein [Rubrivivax sp.]